MVTAVDTSVLLDVLLADPQHGPASETALRQASSTGLLIICEVVIAEITPVLPGPVAEFLQDWNLVFLASSVESATLAGNMFRTYLERGGKRGRVVPDFLIAAHAQLHAQALLARDRGYYRDYFHGLKLLDPSHQPS